MNSDFDRFYRLRYILFMRVYLLYFIMLFALAPPGLAEPARAAEPAAVVAFSPGEKSLALVLETIRMANREILVAAYSFTSKPVSEALNEARKRGVDVRVVADRKGNASKYTAVTYLANQGVPVRLNGRYAIHHHKFLVVDGLHVQTGSFNYSANAAKRNAENVLVLRDVPELAGKYRSEWLRLWDEAEDLPSRY